MKRMTQTTSGIQTLLGKDSLQKFLGENKPRRLPLLRVSLWIIGKQNPNQNCHPLQGPTLHSVGTALLKPGVLITGNVWFPCAFTSLMSAWPGKLYSIRTVSKCQLPQGLAVTRLPSPLQKKMLRSWRQPCHLNCKNPNHKMTTLLL